MIVFEGMTFGMLDQVPAVTSDDQLLAPSQPLMTLAPTPAIPMATPVAAPAAAPALPAWATLFSTAVTAAGQGAQAYAALKAAKKPVVPLPLPGPRLAPVESGPSLTTWILIGGGAIAAIAITVMLVRS